MASRTVMGYLVQTSLIVLMLQAGCSDQYLSRQDQQGRGPLDRLETETSRILKEAGQADPTVRALVIFPRQGHTCRALASLREPPMLYMATRRFVLIIVTPSKVTLRHWDSTRSYPLDPPSTPYPFSSDYDNLVLKLTGNLGLGGETCVVADLELNTIEVEREPIVEEIPYPEVIERYGGKSPEEYGQWLRPKPTSKASQ